MKKSFRTYFLVIIVAILTISSNILFEWLENYLQKYIAATIGLFIIGIIFYFIIKLSQNIEIDIDVEPVRDKVAQKQYAQKGLIIFLSLYKQLPSKSKELTPEQIKEAVKNLDYKVLELENPSYTNYGHQIKAIKTHISKLEHCWIICTRSVKEGKTQSLFYAPVFVKFVKEQISQNLNLHNGEDYSVMLDDDAILCKNTYRLVKRIYKEARKFRLNKDKIITDITGGLRAMTIGAILACMDKSEDIQYIGTNYNDQGDSTGEEFPMVVKYKPTETATT